MLEVVLRVFPPHFAQRMHSVSDWLVHGGFEVGFYVVWIPDYDAEEGSKRDVKFVNVSETFEVLQKISISVIFS